MPSKDAARLAEIAPRIMNAFHDLGRQHPDKSKLSMRQYQAMIILHASETLSLSQLCQKLSLAPSTGTELVNRLVNLGYLKKSTEKEDQRQTNLFLTKKGTKVVFERRKVVSEMITSFLSVFSEKDRTLFVDYFEKIWELIAKYEPHKPTSASETQGK
ncbi:MAG: winged helix-turn-helix transcriptional regulator [Calditrichaeota bacterium]|nr:winged helix-turn-helix transcriptional regulator [Calditrichota bacterium]